MQLLGVEIAARHPVADKGVVVPAVPQPFDDLDEFDGAVVALAVLVMLLAAEIVGFVDGRRRHDVPAGAAAADMVERGEFAGDVIGLVVARRRGGAEADMLGDDGERRQQGQRIEIGHVLRPAGERGEPAVAHRNRVGDEHQVELTALGGLGDLRRNGQNWCRHRSARRDAARRRHGCRSDEKGAELHLLVGTIGSHGISAPGHVVLYRKREASVEQQHV